MVSKPVMRKALDESSPHSHPDLDCPPGAAWDGSKANKGSPDVFVNGQPLMRKGDTYKPHVGTKHKVVPPVDPDDEPACIEVPDQHSPPKAGEGSRQVFANSIGVHLTGQDVECEPEHASNSSKAIGGSPNVFAGE